MKLPRSFLSLRGIIAAGFLFCALAYGQFNDFRAPSGLRAAPEAARIEPFKGVTTDGKVVPNLYAIQGTGVSTEPVRKAAEAFIATLRDEQKKKTLFPADDREWRLWDNRHFPIRQGIGFFEMTEAQRAAALALMRASLSAKGLKQTTDIMKLNGTLGELTQSFDEYSEWFYWITVMGEPSTTKPWGWQLDGHHTIINYFVLGDQVVMTPTFMGSEPIKADFGKFKGTIVLQDEQNKGLELMRALNASQQAKATIRKVKDPENMNSEAYRDNLVLAYAGIRATELSESQKKLLLEVIAEYANNMTPGHARVRMDEVRKFLDQTYFAWIGTAEPDSVFYYRIHSPVILIEFDHQRPIAFTRTNVPTRNHVHTVVRTPNGNDYGKDLLRQHYERNPHDHPHPNVR